MAPISILDRGKHHLVINKPSNTVVVAGIGAPKPTLLDILKNQFGDGIKPVHRLDRVTTGVCIFAKNLFGQQALSDAFRKHFVHKKYLAVVEGVPDFKTLNIDARLKRVDTPHNKKSLAHQEIANDGQRALTRVRVLHSDAGRTLVEARPETGRMHQIRAHLSHIGFPIVGDKQYGAQEVYCPYAIALHAYEISFPLPEGGRRTIQVDPEQKLLALVNLHSLRQLKDIL